MHTKTTLHFASFIIQNLKWESRKFMFMRATHISRKTFHLFCSMMKIYKKKIFVKNRKTYKLLNPSALWIITQKIWKNILPWKNFAFHPKIMYRKSSTLNWFPFSSFLSTN